MIDERGDSRPWYRQRPLPLGELQGSFIVVSPLLPRTRQVLVETAVAGQAEGGHEGLVLWAGRELGVVTVMTTVIAPVTRSGPQGVFVSKEGVGEAGREARALKLGILAQVHSHPGPDGRHSDGDDDLVLMPFEGMLSIVVPEYGKKFTSFADCAVHQFQKGRWVWCAAASVDRQTSVVPDLVDLR